MEYLMIKLITFVLSFIICIKVFYYCFIGLNKQIKDESDNKENPAKNEVNVKYINSSDYIYVLKPSGTIIKNGKVIRKNNDSNDASLLVEQQILLNRKYPDNVKQQIKEGKVIYCKTTGKPKYIEYNPDNLVIDPPKFVIEEIQHDPSYPVRRLGVKYDDVLQDERWKKRRKNILYKRHNVCECCGRRFKNRDLAIHHKYYIKYPNGDVPYPWNYSDNALMCVCHDCHKKIHDEKPIPVYYRKHPLV